MKPQEPTTNQCKESVLVSVKSLSKLLEFGETTIWDLVKSDPSFPKPIRFGDRCTRWKMAEIHAFIESKSAQSMAEAAQ
jgi:predicted DNA-binding transcriptional regulator AlpA